MQAGLTAAGLAFLLAVCAAAAEEPDRELARCASEKNSVKRLECYDRLAERRGVAASPAAEVASAGKWTVRSRTSKIDDSTNVFMSLGAEEDIPDRFGRGSLRPDLVINCLENTTNLFVNWGRYISTQDVRMTHRIDKEKAVTSRWHISTDHEAVGKWGGRSSIPFAKSLFGKSQLLVMVTPYGDSPVTTTFDVGGLEKAIEPLRKACRW